MQKILFPTDFSSNSIHAFGYALKLADNIKADIITLHVYQYPILESNLIDVPLYQAEVYQSLELNDFENYKSHIPILRKVAKQHDLEHIKIENVLLQGDFVPTVLKTVEEQNVDYIVMGTQGASGIKEFFFGSSTATVMTSTNACVLAIPEESRYEPIKKIGFTTQFKTDEFTALKKVVSVAKGFGASVECLYVKTSENEVESVIIANWKLLLKDENVNFHTIESNDVEGMILDFLDLHRINMLAMLNHRMGFWESLFRTSMTKRLAFHLKIPLLALHGDDE